MCPTPPPKKVLIEKIHDAAIRRDELGEDTAALSELISLLYTKKSADTPFLLQVLHLADADDEVFRRDYVYVRPRPVKAQVSMPFIDN